MIAYYLFLHFLLEAKLNSDSFRGNTVFTQPQWIINKYFMPTRQTPNQKPCQSLTPITSYCLTPAIFN